VHQIAVSVELDAELLRTVPARPSRRFEIVL
jgi:hypothetical protein